MGEAMQDDMVTITVDGRALEANKGQMLIEVTDAAGISIPRFCYHPKLSIAANCRMCLVEVEKAPKPLPACATPVVDGMVVRTQSPLTLDAQKGTMEFLLINHPLDCPVCDQGGECELQDLSLTYGGSGSRYVEEKRAVPDKDIGALVATEMTRCIHCTRCIRFGDEIAGLREMGGVYRGEHVEIGTYIEKSLVSELSGNIIDLCPVGALTAKPSRFVGRSWEYQQHDAIAPHDGVGSHIAIHTLRGRIVRVVAREAESINENWISDRDRFAYEGIHSPDRALKPWVKGVGELDWETALAELQNRLQKHIDQYGAHEVGVLVSPNTTLEEGLLIKALCNQLGIDAVDHRLRQQDHRFTQNHPDYLPWLGQSIAEVEQNQAILLVDCNVRMEQPLLGHRVRKAARNGAAVYSVAPEQYDFRFNHQPMIVPGAAMLSTIAACAVEAAKHNALRVAPAIVELAKSVPAHVNATNVIDALKSVEYSSILLGSEIIASEYFSLYQQMLHLIAAGTNSALGYLPSGSNTLGLSMIGLPGEVDAATMISAPKKAYLLWNVEPELDMLQGSLASEVIDQAELVISVNAFADETMQSSADIILPIASFGEQAGTYVNIAGQAQSFTAAQRPSGESRPGWRLARVLGDLFAVDGEGYLDISMVQAQAYQRLEQQQPAPVVTELEEYDFVPATGEEINLIGQVGIYQTDALVRRSAPLQSTVLAQTEVARAAPSLLAQLGLQDGDQVQLTTSQGGGQFTIVEDPSIADNSISIQKATPLSAALGAASHVQIQGV